MTENRKIKTQKSRIDLSKKLKKVKLLFTKQAKSETELENEIVKVGDQAPNAFL